MKIFAGSNSKVLGYNVVQKLGLKLSEAKITKFQDGELAPVLLESVRGEKVFLIQSTDGGSDHVLELLLMIDALKRSSAKEINCIIPYFGYARQDRQDQPRTSIGAKLMIDMIQTAGADRIISVDIHALQIQGFANIPFDLVEGHSIFRTYFQNQNFKTEDVSICSPDLGGIKRAKSFGYLLSGDQEPSFSIINKERIRPNEVDSMKLIGDVQGKNVIIIDDMVDTAGTLCKAASYLKSMGALSVQGFITHAIFSGDALDRIKNSDLDKLIISDTTTQFSNKIMESPSILSELGDKIMVISTAPVIAEVIERLNVDKSITHLNESKK